MKRRRWLKPLLILVGIFVVLLVLFSLLVFNPFEPDMKDLDGMVPLRFEKREVSFVVRAPSLAALKESPFFSQRIQESEFWESLFRDHGLDQYLTEQLSDLELNIKRVLAGVVDFDLMEDVVGQEVMFAGALDLEDIPASPYIFLTRVSWRTKLVLAALRYEKIRKQIEAQSNVRIREERFWYEITELDPERKRSQKDELTYYVARARDVFAFASHPALIKEAIFLSESQGAESLRYKHGGYMKSLPYRTEGREVAAWFDVLELNEAPNQLFRRLEPITGEPRSVEDLLTELIPPRIQYDASASLDLSDGSLLRASVLLGEVKEDEIPKHIDTFYRGEWIDVRETIEELGAFAPVDRTVAVAGLSVSPESFLRVFFSYLKSNTQRLIMDELREVGETPEDVIDDLGQYLTRPLGFVVTRINEAVDGLPLDSMSEGGKIHPRPAYHLTMRFHSQDRIDVFTEAFVDRVRRLGFMDAKRKPDVPADLPDVRYWSMPIKSDEESDPLLKPAMAVRGDRFFFSTNGSELLRCLRTAPSESLAGAEDLEAILEAAPREAGLIILLRGDRFRAYLTDQRFERAIDDAEAATTDQRVLLKVRSDIARELTAAGMKQDAEYRKIREERVDQWVAETRKRVFDEGIARWRGVVRKLEPIRNLLLTLAPLPDESEGTILVDCAK